jgi:hypothetical protein
LERWLALQIAGVYHLTVHSALGKTPLAAWEEGLAKRKQQSSVSLAASALCGGVALLLAWGVKAFVCLTLFMFGKNAVQRCTADVVSVRDLSSRVFPAFPHG